MKKLTVLGNCANQTAEYETANYILDLGIAKVLLDVGPGAVKQLYKAGFLATDIDIIIITHCHGDHTSGFPYFAFSNFMERLQGKNGSSNIPIIALPEVYKGLMDMLAFCYPPGKFHNFDIENWPASDSEKKVFKFKNIKITTTPVMHTVPAIGVRFDINSTSITFSSDTIYDKRLVDLARGSKMLVHEALATMEMAEIASQVKHATAEEAGKAAKESRVQSLILVHVSPMYREKKEQLIEEASKYFSGEIILPSELEEIKIED
ncbi:unnamed protein product [marine sediment metagenome]|uniref:Uncharacterized protein n=1 Tax=marine sediment metagenome TaxID=412755 RepID=X1GBG6_9ZZZZ